MENAYLCIMINNYHSDIMEILLPCGRQGMRLHRIVKRVCNSHADLFQRGPDYEDVYRCIALYLWKQSHRRESPFCRNSYGVYAVKPDIAVQLDLFWDLSPLKDRPSSHTSPLPNPSLQLELFPDFC